MSVKSGYKQTEIGIIPENWEVVPLNNLVYRPLAYGVLKPGEYEDNGVYMLRIQDIKTKNIDYKSLFRIPKSLDLEFKRTKLKEGDLILSLVGTIGKVLKINNKLSGANVTRAFGVIGIKEKESVDYIEQYLSSHFMQKWIQDQSKGNAQKVLNIENIKKMPIIYPTLEEQKKIADILSAVDKKIAFVEENINATEELKKGLMQKLLTEGIGHAEFKDSELGRIPESWETKKLNTMLEDKFILSHLDGNHGGLYPTQSEFVNNGVPYISANMIKNSRVDFSNSKYLTKERASLFRKGVAKNNDILFAHNATVGPVALLKTDLEYVILSTTLTYYRCDSSKLSNLYILYYMQSPTFVNQYEKTMKQSTRNQIPITQQRNLYFVLPPLVEQKQIADILSTVDKKLENLKEQKESFEELKKGLMQKLLTGEVRV